MYQILALAAGFSFILHVLFLVLSFKAGHFYSGRYFVSHLTLWLTGLLLYILVQAYAGTGRSTFLDYFDSPMKKASILVVALCLSLIAHLVVKRLILPPIKNATRKG